MNIIGITGLKLSGKTTVAEFIKQLLPNKVVVYGFADPLKDEICQAVGHTREYLETNKKHFRLILQGWGTDYRRELYGQNYWVKKMEQAADEFEQRRIEILVIPDVRFLNEAAMILSNSGKVMRVVRSGLEVDNHQSEVEQQRIVADYTIINDSTLAGLKLRTIEALQTLCHYTRLQGQSPLIN